MKHIIWLTSRAIGMAVNDVQATFIQVEENCYQIGQLLIWRLYAESGNPRSTLPVSGLVSVTDRFYWYKQTGLCTVGMLGRWG